MSPDEIPAHVIRAWETSPGCDGRTPLAAALTAYIDGPTCPDDVLAVIDEHTRMWRRTELHDSWFSPGYNPRAWRDLVDQYGPLTLLVKRADQ